MAYHVDLSPHANRQIDRLRGVARIALLGVVLARADDPRPRGALRITGMRNIWRVRVRIDDRPWRVIYQVDDTDQLVVILRVAARDESTYRRLR